MRKFTCSREGALIFMYRAQPDMSRHKGPANGMAGRRERALDYRLIIEFTILSNSSSKSSGPDK